MKLLTIMALLLMGLTGACQSENPEESKKEAEMKFKVEKPEKEWKSELSEEEYFILRKKGTEYPHTGKYNLHFEDGIYRCAGCGNPLFKSDSKFESNCGWPSFDSALSDSTVVEVPDNSHGMRRIEILCASCGGHLGHVFPDGPTNTGMRYCINSGALNFDQSEKD